jgi:hypothetical protein
VLTTNRETIKRILCSAGVLSLLGLAGSSVGYDHLPYVLDVSPDDFVCISGSVYDSATEEPLVGVGVCVFPEGIPADTLEPAGIIHENGFEYPVPQMPGFRWIVHTDYSGAFAICDIPVWLSDRTFSAVIYKPSYIPEFPQGITITEGPGPPHSLSFWLEPSTE